ncbi:MAG: hypothetical protein OEZ47_00245 [Gammaproteobacteria bacterium]|nr:hypothetical protein [Gammaproteobacteria bacterium]
MKRLDLKVAALLVAMSSGSAWAVNAPDLTKLNQTTFDSFADDFTAAMSYKAVAPAEPLGITGFDIGLEVTATELTGVKDWGAAIGSTSLDIVPIPKVHLHKGLPFGLDLGAVYTSIPGLDVSYFGGEVRYSFLGGNVALPAIALRGTYTKVSGVKLLDMSTMGAELTISKGFLMLTPYAGVGQVMGSAKLDSDFKTLSGLKDGESSLFKTFAGLNFNMGLMNLAGEWDKTGDSTSYSLKFGFRF